MVLYFLAGMSLEFFLFFIKEKKSFPTVYKVNRHELLSSFGRFSNYSNSFASFPLKQYLKNTPAIIVSKVSDIRTVHFFSK